MLLMSLQEGYGAIYDLIILDEVSQVDSDSWAKLQTALGELCPGPFIVFVGDFQQLQPICGPPRLQRDLDRQVQQGHMPLIELQHHQAARSVDPEMLDFLTMARVQQPSRAVLEDFFRGRVWSGDIHQAVQKARQLEAASSKPFTFLTVTNRGAERINLARLSMEYPTEAGILANGGGIPAELGTVVLAPGMRMRLTYNVDKDKGFVNGNSGIIRALLRKDVFILQSTQNVSILVHPITVKGRKFLPVTYGWATTMRRAQGATLDHVGLWFDRRQESQFYEYERRYETALHLRRHVLWTSSCLWAEAGFCMSVSRLPHIRGS